MFTATKEAAYVQALSLIAIAHTVTSMCAKGTTASCACVKEDIQPLLENDSSVYQLGCADSVNFGVQFSRTFLFKRHIMNTTKTLIEQHNMMIGALVSHIFYILYIYTIYEMY